MFGLEVADSSLSTRSGALDLTIRHINDNRSDEAIVIINEFGHKKKVEGKC